VNPLIKIAANVNLCLKLVALVVEYRYYKRGEVTAKLLTKQAPLEESTAELNVHGKTRENLGPRNSGVRSACSTQFRIYNNTYP
jgi:hypothetical protein